MNKTCLAIFVLAQLSSVALAAEITLSESQIDKLGIHTAALPPQQSGELAGVPAQVVIPGNQLYMVSTPLAGMIEQTLVGVGDTVRKGQLLAKLQSPAFVEAQRSLLQAHMQSQLADENLNRDQSLWKDGIIAESRLRATRSQRNEAHALLSERSQTVKLFGMSAEEIKRLLSNNELSSQLAITSPISGIILDKSADSGQRLDAATPLFKVAKLNPLALEIQLPLASASNLKVGAAVTIPAFAASGKLTAIGHSLSGGNQTILVRALIDKGTDNLRAGQFIEASIATENGQAAQWNIPNGALSRLGDQAVVFVRTASGFRSENVTVIHEGVQSSVIHGALKGDEQIAIQGVSTLKSSTMGIGGGE